MKKIWLIAVIAVAMLAILVACDKAQDQSTHYVVTQNYNYVGAPAPVVLRVDGASGLAATALAEPTREGYLFDGWYWDEQCTDPLVFEAGVASLQATDAITVYAGWKALVASISARYVGGEKTVGDAVQRSDFAVQATYTDGSTDEVADFAVGEFDSSEAGVKNVIISYAGKTAEATVVVKEVAENPDTPDEPTTPDGPTTPDEPTTPENPDTPDEPDSPQQPETLTLYYYNSNQWPAVSAYAYDTNGKLYLGEGGTQMTENADGWFSVEVPNDEYYISFVCDGAQSRTYYSDGTNVYFALGRTFASLPDIDEVEIEVAIEFSSRASILSYNEDRGGYYSGSETVNADDLAVIHVYVNDTAIEFDGYGGEGKYKVLVSDRSGRWVAYFSPADGPFVPVETTRTIYFVNDQGWQNVYAFVFNSAAGKARAEWPGEAMTLVGQNADGQDVYSYTFSVSYDGVSFSDGSVRTVDAALNDLEGGNNAYRALYAYTEDDYPDDDPTKIGKWAVGQWQYQSEEE